MSEQHTEVAGFASSPYARNDALEEAARIVETASDAYDLHAIARRIRDLQTEWPGKAEHGARE